MNYKFPEIRHISDILPHIEGRTEFIVAERDFGSVINYVVTKSDTFDMEGPDDLGGAIRRECRGIMFNPKGNIMSRPFHKFFNVNERPETHMNSVDMTQPHTIMEKMDGCLDKETLILCADYEYRIISEVIENKIDVLGVTENGEVTPAKYIEGLITKSDKNWVEIVTENGCIYCTEDHKFLTDDGYVEAKDLEGHNLKEII